MHQICRTPLLPSVQSDKAVSKFEKNGIYSVRSAYRNIIDRNLTVHQHRINGNWNQIWHLKVPPRIKNFLWRVTRGCLPSRLRLQSRGVTCPVQCPFCNEQEDNIHALFMCNNIRQCWQRSDLWNIIATATVTTYDISAIVLEILHRLDNNQ